MTAFGKRQNGAEAATHKPLRRVSLQSNVSWKIIIPVLLASSLPLLAFVGKNIKLNPSALFTKNSQPVVLPGLSLAETIALLKGPKADFEKGAKLPVDATNLTSDQKAVWIVIPCLTLGMFVKDKHPDAQTENCAVTVKDKHLVMVGMSVYEGALRWGAAAKLSQKDETPGNWQTEDTTETAPVLATTR